MSYDATIKDTPVKAVRKPHRCEWCSEMILVGQSARYRAYRFEGAFQAA